MLIPLYPNATNKQNKKIKNKNENLKLILYNLK